MIKILRDLTCDVAYISGIMAHSFQSKYLNISRTKQDIKKP